MQVEADAREGISEWTVVALATPALGDAVVRIQSCSQLEAVEDEISFLLLLAQAFFRRLRTELRVECIGGEFVGIFTLPTQQAGSVDSSGPMRG
ncbi:MAG: hypothetical protein NZ960_01285 [Candidatus Kapabacteria bacterium]|nr:hypothetical protein [Candidatus Kapabacteria bacterium]MDW8011660.1 hypothetical protein [Bacteroidota bacterium]